MKMLMRMRFHEGDDILGAAFRNCQVIVGSLQAQS